LPYPLIANNSVQQSSDTVNSSSSCEKKDWLSDVPFKLASCLESESNHDEIANLLRKSGNLLTQDLLLSLQYDFNLERSVV